MKIRNRLWFNYLLYFSFIPFLINGITYFAINIIYPFLFSLLVIGIIVFTLVNIPNKALKMIKIWSIMIISYAVIRILLFGSVLIEERVIPSGIFYQFTLLYHLKTIGFLILGYVCFSKRKCYIIEHKKSQSR